MVNTATCRYCGSPLHEEDEVYVDDTDGDCCSGNDEGDNENEPHVPATKQETIVPTFGIYELELTGPEAALDRFGPAHVEIRLHPNEHPDGLEYKGAEALCQRFQENYDDLPDDCLPLEFSPPTQITNEFVNPDGTQTYFVTVYEAGQGYGGPEEGGWWYDTGDPIRHYACRSYDEAVELRDHLRATEFPHTGKRSSVLGGDDWDVAIDLEPGKAFPERIPRYE